jgi:hypothetical protein
VNTATEFEVWLAAQVGREDETGILARSFERGGLDLSFPQTREALRVARAEYDSTAGEGVGGGSDL